MRCVCVMKAEGGQSVSSRVGAAPAMFVVATRKCDLPQRVLPGGGFPRRDFGRENSVNLSQDT